MRLESGDARVIHRGLRPAKAAQQTGTGGLGVNSDADASADAQLADQLTTVIAKAAAAIRAADYRGVASRLKSDGSRVTAADEAAEAIILSELAHIAPRIPVVSEESAGGSSDVRTCFLVDPLDGTAEFLAGRDEYTINIAVVRDGAPVIGLIAAPASGIVWRGVVGRGAERLTSSPDYAGLREATPIRARPWPAGRRVTAAVSRTHYEAASAAFLRRLGVTETIACGSALKFARIAEGAADVYPRLAPTCEWDVAAGHALVTAAGGTVTAPDGTPLSYGRTSDFRVPGFIAWGDPRAAADQAVVIE
jgi:3'(2'), 5'-bisphosphate nucleotidase